MSIQTIRPATTRGPVTGSNLRVVYDEEKVVVVSASNTTYLTLAGEPVEARAGRLMLPTTDGELTVIKQGGCSCGKPWLTKPPSGDLLAAAPVG